MLKEVWFKTSEIDFRLPIEPSSFERLTSVSYATEKVLNLGDVAMYDSKGLAKISFDVFFPNHEYSFNSYKNVKSPYECIKWLKKWEMEGSTVRIILTGTDINQLMRITDLNYGEKDGTGDVYYTVDLIEHRTITVPKLEPLTGASSSNSNSNNSTNRPVEKPPATQKTHVVGAGDSLWSLAKKYYGKGSLWKKIADANVKTYPSLKNNPDYIRDGWKLVIP